MTFVNVIRNDQVMFSTNLFTKCQGQFIQRLLESVRDSCLIEQDCYNLAVFCFIRVEKLHKKYVTLII